MQEEISKKVPALLADIHSRFPKVRWPQGEQITYGTTAEEIQIRADFAEQVWWDISPAVLRANYGSMAFFTPFAYHYFLPSYLHESLVCFDPNNYVFMFTVFSLSPVKTDRSDPEYSRRLDQFSQEQRDVIIRFLHLILEEPFYSLWNDAERGLRKFWTN